MATLEEKYAEAIKELEALKFDIGDMLIVSPKARIVLEKYGLMLHIRVIEQPPEVIASQSPIDETKEVMDTTNQPTPAAEGPNTDGNNETKTSGS